MHAMISLANPLRTMSIQIFNLELLFRFLNPEYLWLLVLLPLLAFWRGGRGKAASVRFPAISLARQVSAFVRSRPGRFVARLRLIALAFLILALARPQSGSGSSEIETSGIDIILAVDLSTSMWAHDFEIDDRAVDRLTVVKGVMEEFVQKRGSDRIGIVAFAAEPYLVSPLTLNHEWLDQNLQRLRIGLVEDGTAIGSAIAMSVNRLRAQRAKSRILILLTDGANNRGTISPAAAAEAAAAFDIKTYTIGAGKGGPVPFPQGLDASGNPVRDRFGRVRLRRAESSIDIETLEEIADITDGRFFHATDTRSLGKIYDEIDQLEKTEIALNYRASFSDVFMWPALGGLFFLGLELILANTRYRRLP